MKKLQMMQGAALRLINAMGYGSTYDGVQWSRNRTQIPTIAKDSDCTFTPTVRRSLTSSARYLFNNVGLVRGAFGDMARYSIGDGILPQAQTPDEGWNTAAEAYWGEWVKRADWTRQRTFYGQLRITSRSMDRDGDMGIAFVKDGSGPQIQLIEGHRIGDLPGRKGSCDGVVLDSSGRVSAYRVIVDEKTTRDIPASSFILLADPDRVDQYRGQSALVHAINHLRDLKDIVGFEKTGVKNASAIAAFIYNALGQADGNDWDTAKNAGSTATDINFEEIQGGQIRRLANGDKMEISRSDRPGAAWMGFTEFLMRDVATGMSLPFEFIWNAEKLGGANQRFIMQKANRRFSERRGLYTDCTLPRTWGFVIGDAIASGELTDNPLWYRVKWQPPKMITVDVGREAQQDREDLKIGARTLQEHYSEQGMDWEEQIEQKGREAKRIVEVAKRNEVPVEMIQQLTPNGAPAPAAPVEPVPGA